MIFDKAIKTKFFNSQDSPELTFCDPAGWRGGTVRDFANNTSYAMKLSAVNACVEVITNSISKLPVSLIQGDSKERQAEHPALALLCDRPNEAMTPSVYKKLMESYRLLGGNGYSWIVRNPSSGRPVELIPLSDTLCTPYFDDNGKLWYVATHPLTGQMYKLPSYDVCHVKAYSRDGIRGVSVLTRAAEVISTGLAAQRYESRYYNNNAQPIGILTTDSDVDKKAKDKIRREWEMLHSGADNAFKIAVLDRSLKYQAIATTNKDNQFIESKELSVADIARFFGVPLYKLSAGSQSYQSNEQNGMEYVVNTLHPIVTQYEEEYTHKLLTETERKQRRYQFRINMMAELRGDSAARASWYREMRNASVFSVNDVRDFEDMPHVPGGDERRESLNFVPLDLWRELSIHRNKNKV